MQCPEYSKITITEIQNLIGILVKKISNSQILFYSFPGVPPRNPKVSVPLSSPLQNQNQQTGNGNQYQQHGGHSNGFNGAKPRFLSSSPAAKKMHQNPNASANAIVLSPSKMNLSAIHSVSASSSGVQSAIQSPALQSQSASNNNTTGIVQQGHHQQGQQNNNCNNNSRGQTPDWIRDIFHHAKRGNREKLVSTYIHYITHKDEYAHYFNDAM